MNLVVGDLWDELGKADLILVTGNATINARGELVMGRGAAREARDRFPGLARDLGSLIREDSRYGVAIAAGDYHPATAIGVFQVKFFYRDDADPVLIAYSVRAVRELHPFRRIALNYPGIGNGRLRIEDVEPIVAALPDNVFIYRRK